MKYKEIVTLNHGETRRVDLRTPEARMHVIQVNGPGTASIRGSINAEAGFCDLSDLTETLILSTVVGLEAWEITASGGPITVTLCGD